MVYITSTEMTINLSIDSVFFNLIDVNILIHV